MKLLTVGDSFTWGEELTDKMSAWPYQLANKLGYEVTNLARPGSGNSRMVRNCIEQVNNYDMVIVAWSHFARTEWADHRGVYDIWPGCSAQPHETTAPWRKYLIEHINWNHDDAYLYRQYLINIILLQNYLESNNKRYLMLDAFGNHQHKERTKQTNKDLIDQIDRDYFLGWPNESMMEWTHNTPQGTYKHFLEPGHAIVADKIYDYLGHLSWQY